MRHKYISKQSNELLSYFNERDKKCFNYSEAKVALPQSKESAIKELLSDMTKRGLLMRLKKGLYYIIPYEQEAESFMPDWHLIAEYLVKDANHYIGYYSALQMHNLITQPSLKEQIVVSRQIRPSSIKIKIQFNLQKLRNITRKNIFKQIIFYFSNKENIRIFVAGLLLSPYNGLIYVENAILAKASDENRYITRAKRLTAI